MNASKKAAVFILLGQSNATGHGIFMKQEDIIQQPLKNVFGLHRQHNQSYDIRELTWTGYTSHGMNLGETQDNTYSVANCLAQQWQSAVDAGADLPDLYIVHISIGAQGVTEKYMWFPDREKVLLPGTTFEANISLHPLSVHIFSLLQKSFQTMGKEFEIIGLHWRGGEEDGSAERDYLEANLKPIYLRLFRDFREALQIPTPIIIHNYVCYDRADFLDPSGKSRKNIYFINDLFRTLAQELADVSIFDITKAPMYLPDVKGNGIYVEDLVHYTPEVNTWVAKCILEDYQKA